MNLTWTGHGLKRWTTADGAAVLDRREDGQWTLALDGSDTKLGTHLGHALHGAKLFILAGKNGRKN